MAAARALRIGQHVKELRIHLCQKSPSSKGVREFVEQHYVALKKDNPKFPILIRECSDTQPKIYARYGMGRETSVPLTDLDAKQVLQAVESLTEKSTT